jgi:hypothetical protein
MKNYFGPVSVVYLKIIVISIVEVCTRYKLGNLSAQYTVILKKNIKLVSDIPLPNSKHCQSTGAQPEFVTGGEGGGRFS